MRISLAAEPEEEIKIGFDILKSSASVVMGWILSPCPSCSRQEFDVIPGDDGLRKTPRGYPWTNGCIGDWL